jgi:hypothetical protein
MIFKYLSYDKTKRIWVDNKDYLSICPNIIDTKITSHFVETIHSAIVKRNLTAITIDNFSMSDVSEYNRRKYGMYTVLAGRRWNFARLVQLPKIAKEPNPGFPKSILDAYALDGYTIGGRPRTIFGDYIGQPPRPATPQPIVYPPQEYMVFNAEGGVNINRFRNRRGEALENNVPAPPPATRAYNQYEERNVRYVLGDDGQAIQERIYEAEVDIAHYNDPI